MRNARADKRRRGAFWGFLLIGIFGGLVAHFSLRSAQDSLREDHPLNERYQEAPGWVPGLLLIVGPLAGWLFGSLAGNASELPESLSRNPGEPASAAKTLRGSSASGSGSTPPIDPPGCASHQKRVGH
ncbi:unnamed protein product [Tuwongella immobilis]|uniref:Uncharacterized protein n=1 Tax=Tuwongella immobilis TaxID=692036 RepID=A0A6C2YRI8_9BACT|nr:unnamed protein product [Tuwongella immobilis]VTS04353.1 unnamed protein product [Tuwongella immobilis]